MKFIEHIIEPEKLLLSWQTSQTRGRMFVAELIRNVKDADLVYLVDSKEFKQAKELGFNGYPGFGIEQTRYESILFAFMKRLPPRNRGDFGKYLNALRLQPDVSISDFALIGYSGAKLPDDDFTIINPFENAAPPFEFLLQIQGYRYYKEKLPLSSLIEGQEAIFEAEPNNVSDPEAIKILINGIHAGYVSRGLTGSLKQWSKEGYLITASVERINGTEERPAVYLYVSITTA